MDLPRRKNGPSPTFLENLNKSIGRQSWRQTTWDVKETCCEKKRTAAREPKQNCYLKLGGAGLDGKGVFGNFLLKVR